MKRNLCVLAIWWAFALGMSARDFVHPGGLHTLKDLARMKEKVKQKETPWIETWELLANDPYAQSSYTARPYTNIGGTGNRQQAGRDAYAAYLNTLYWYITDDVSHADCAVRILNAWAGTVKEASGELYQIPINAMVQVAELLRGYEGWKEEDQEKFKTVCRTIFYPACEGFYQGCSHQSWDAPAASARMIMAVFLDDEEKFNNALDYFKEGEGEGSLQHTLNPTGQLPEMGRDQPHAALGIASQAQICQVAWNQGEDLFAYADNLLLKGFDYYCKFNLGYPVEWENYHWCGSPEGYDWFHISISDAYRINNSPVYEMIYNHYVVERGLSAPYLTQLVNLARPENGEEGYFGYGTLTYTLDASYSPYPAYPIPEQPVGLKAEPCLEGISLQWNAPKGRTGRGYKIYRSENGKTFTKIHEWDNNTKTEYKDETVFPGVSYTYYVSAWNQSGESLPSEVSVAVAGGGTGILPKGWGYTDVGQVAEKGGFVAMSAGGNFMVSLSGGGADVGGISDGHGYVFTKVQGDLVASARLYKVDWKDGNNKVGWVIRESLAPEARRITLNLGDYAHRYSRMGVRRNHGDNTQWFEGNDFTVAPVWFKLERDGNVFSAYQSVDGNEWYKFAEQALDFATTCYVGLSASAGTSSPLAVTACFDHVTIESEGEVPTMPVNFKGVATGSTSLRLSWDGSAECAVYILERATSLEGEYKVVNEKIIGSSYEDVDLQPDVTYYYRLSAANLYGEGKKTAPLAITTEKLSLPEAPSKVEALSGNGFVALSWAKTGEKTAYYQVRRGDLYGGPYELVGRTLENKYTDNKVVNGNMYYYTVSAVNAVGEGKPSEEAKALPRLGDSRYWPFDEEQGNLAVDIWNFDEVQLVNSVHRNVGKYNSGISLTGGHIALPAGGTEKWKDFSLSVWVKPERVDTWARIIDCGTGTDNNFFLTVRAAQTGCLRYAIVQGTSGEQQINTDFSLKASEWVHVVLVQRGTTGILYANGTEVGRNENLTLSPADLGYTTQNYIGRSAYMSDPYFRGCVDDLRIYDCALDSEQVSALYQASTQQVTFPALPGMKVGDEELISSATASSGLSLEFRSSHPEVAEVVDGCRIRALSPGKTEITALQTGNLLYASAVPVTQTLMVEHGNGVESVDTGQMKVGIRLNGHILQFSFSKPVEERGKAMLFDMNGKLVRSTVLNGHGCFTWNLSGLSSGVYLFKLDGGSWAKKLKIVL